MGARALIAAAVLLLCSCGPRPKVEKAELRREGGRMMAQVLVSNRGGEGEASVTVRLRERGTGREFVKELGVALERKKSSWLALDTGAPAGDYEVSAEVQYPP